MEFRSFRKLPMTAALACCCAVLMAQSPGAFVGPAEGDAPGWAADQAAVSAQAERRPRSSSSTTKTEMDISMPRNGKLPGRHSAVECPMDFSEEA